MIPDKHETHAASRSSFIDKQRRIESSRVLFQLLAAMLKNASLYPEGHPSLRAAADKLENKTHEILTERNEAAFYLVDGELFFENLSLPLDQNLSLVIEQFSAKKIGGIVLEQGITAEELVKFSLWLNQEMEWTADHHLTKEWLARQGMPHIRLHHAMLVDKNVGNHIRAEQKKAADIFKETIETLKEVVQAVHRDKASNMRKVNSVIQSMVDYVLHDKDTLVGLTNLKMYDEYTYAHCVNTAILAVATGTYLSMNKHQLSALGAAALLHDIGKINVPSEIINKPEALTEEEWAIVKRHPIDGALFLCAAQNISKLAAVVSFEHHQHGKKPYPPLKENKRRHPFSQIVSLADSYEAITAMRVYYARQVPPDKAIRILLMNKGLTSSIALLKAFIHTVGIFPAGTLLKLDSGEIGLVIQQTQDLTRPRVLLLDKFDGSEKENGRKANLTETRDGKYTRSIVGTLDPFGCGINVRQYFD